MKPYHFQRVLYLFVGPTAAPSTAPPPPSYNQAMNDPTDVKPLSTDPEKALVDI